MDNNDSKPTQLNVTRAPQAAPMTPQQHGDYVVAQIKSWALQKIDTQEYWQRIADLVATRVWEYARPLFNTLVSGVAIADSVRNNGWSALLETLYATWLVTANIDLDNTRKR